MSWYAIQTRSNCESKVHASFDRDGIPDLFPFYRQTVKWSDRQKVVDRPIFPGYLFVDQRQIETRIHVLSTIGVLRILSTPVPDPEIETVQRLLSSPESLAAAVPELYKPHQGDMVQIVYGPMVGLQGLVTRTKGKLRVWVSIPSMMCGVPVQVDAQSLRRVQRAA